MSPTYKELLKALHEKYPEKHIGVDLHNRYFAHTDEYEPEYSVYVEDVACKFLPTLSEVKLFVEYLCKREVENE